MTSAPDMEFSDAPDLLLQQLNLMEDIATASEDADLIFEIMELKQRLGYSVARPSTPTN